MSNKLSQQLSQLQILSDDKVFIYPNIPLKKIKNALDSYGCLNINHEEIIILIDDTLFGSAKNGILITDDTIYIKNTFSKSIAISFKDIKNISHSKSKLFINNQEIIDCSMPSKNSCEILYNFLEKFINTNINSDLSKNSDAVNHSLHTNDSFDDLNQLKNEALQGNIEAQYNLGKYYFDRREDKDSLDKSFFWFEKAAENSNSKIQYEIGICYDICDNEDKAFYWYKKAADNGHNEAQLDVGLAYMLGKGTEPDEFEGHKWFNIAVENGNIDAMWSLGRSYLYGEGTDQDYEKAFYWFRKGAEKGDAMSQNSLGLCYKKGRGTKQDNKKAFYWIKKSAEQGNKIAQGNLGDYYRTGSITSIDMNKSYFWYQKSAEQGDEYSVKALNKYFFNDGTPKSFNAVNQINQNNENFQADENITQQNTKSNSRLNETETINLSLKINRARTNPTFSDSLFKPIAHLNGYAIIIIALLKNKATDKILTIISKIPGIGMIGIMGKLVLNKPLEWLNEQFIGYGEQFIMDKLVYNWQTRGIGYDELLKHINTIPSFLIEEHIINDSKMLLEKYYN